MERSSPKSAEREQQRGSSRELTILRQMILLQQDGINRNGVWSVGGGGGIARNHGGGADKDTALLLKSL